MKDVISTSIVEYSLAKTVLSLAPISWSINMDRESSLC